MKMAEVIGLLGPSGEAALAAWCEDQVAQRSSDRRFAFIHEGLRSTPCAEAAAGPTLWAAKALVAATWEAAYDWWNHFESPGVSVPAAAAQASLLAELWAELAVLSGSTPDAAKVVGTLAQVWEPPAAARSPGEAWRVLLDVAAAASR
ncbi:MAG: hypothetical protein KDB04_07435 [Acidimicrobiales bacterium]|nr:hypothetical protein [Acidimicrobiales bacterium]